MSAARTARAEDPVAPSGSMFRNPWQTGAVRLSGPLARRIRSPPAAQCSATRATGTGRPGPLARRIRSLPATQCSATPGRPAPFGCPDRSRGGSGRSQRLNVPQPRADVPQPRANRHRSAVRTARAEDPVAPSDSMFRNPAQTGTGRRPGPLARRIRSLPATQCSATPLRCSATPGKPAPVSCPDRPRQGPSEEVPMRMPREIGSGRRPVGPVAAGMVWRASLPPSGVAQAPGRRPDRGAV